MSAPLEAAVHDLAARLRAGDRAALARAISLVEAGDPAGLLLSESLFATTGNAHTIGITGPPGAGKSTLTDALIREYRGRNLRVAVLAVDPVSPRTGGATLGDRIRMTQTAADNGVFVRSSAARGNGHGLGLTTAQVVRLMDAAGYDRILIETVGTGQDGVTIATVAATILLVQTPGSGDEVQALKAGILEVADIFVVNKAELPGTDALLHDLREVARATRERSIWLPPVLPTTARDGTGIVAVADAIEAHRAHLTASPEGERRAMGRLWAEVRALVRNEVLATVEQYLSTPAGASRAVAALQKGADPISVARAVLADRRWTRES